MKIQVLKHLMVYIHPPTHTRVHTYRDKHKGNTFPRVNKIWKCSCSHRYYRIKLTVGRTLLITFGCLIWCGMGLQSNSLHSMVDMSGFWYIQGIYLPFELLQKRRQELKHVRIILGRWMRVGIPKTWWEKKSEVLCDAVRDVCSHLHKVIYMFSSLWVLGKGMEE